MAAALYASPDAEKGIKLGYAQSGAKLAATRDKKPGPRCDAGYIKLIDGTWICSALGTLDATSDKTHFSIRRPNLDEVLPYQYARNTKNGTPLYRSVPSKDQMQSYEPYLKANEEARAAAAAAAAAGSATPAANSANPAASAAPSTSAAPTQQDSEPAPTEAPPADRPWWQKESADAKLHEVKLTDLRADSDDILALRMVKGFYVAVDRTFRWSGRTWYKTTKGLVAPADRMGLAAPSEFQGVMLTEGKNLPLGWTYPGREKTVQYDFDTDKKRMKPSGGVGPQLAVELTGKTETLSGAEYSETKDGHWLRSSQLRVTTPGEPPTDMKPDETWVDVDLSSQTLVVFKGKTPVFATLVSTGKYAKSKDRDHSTPTGQWRIREKHITTTMDGDGSAAGDLPYSIEDVPYVMYFHRSYALHGAFWHRNFGVQMSHGCVNIAPLDAKRVFFLTSPDLGSEWHGAWSAADKPGSWVSVHD